MNTGLHVRFCVIVFSKNLPRRKISELYGNSVFYFIFFFRNLFTVLCSGYTSLHFASTMLEASHFSTSPTAFIICSVFDDGHSEWCEVILHCRFDLHFSSN